MGFADTHGRARVSTTWPEGFGVCDDCGEWYNRVDLRAQYEYAGRDLIFLGYYKCRTCLDEPQPQLLTPILPRDPVPIIEPRPEATAIDFGLMGFTQFTLNPPILADQLPKPDPAKAQVLAAVAALSGVPTPAPFGDNSGILSAAVTTLPLVKASPNRSWIVIYNPSVTQLVVSTGQAAFAGDPFAIILGPGNALLWATAQGGPPPTTSALTVNGYLAGQPVWVFQKPGAGGISPYIPVLFP